MDATAQPAILLTLAALALGGCLSEGVVPGGGEALDVAGHATLSLRSEEAESHVVTASTSVGGTPVDTASQDVRANGTASLSVGVPARGNVQIRVTATNGGVHEMTLAVSSCKGISVSYALRDGTLQALETRC